MSAAPEKQRGSSRRLRADRRSALNRRESSERRMRHRREFVVPIDAENRNRTDRRDMMLRREASNRRVGASRRFDERRRRPGSSRILVVDGQETVRGGIKRVLGGAGHEVIEAHEGTAGLNYYFETPADAGSCKSHTTGHGWSRFHPTDSRTLPIDQNHRNRPKTVVWCSGSACSRFKAGGGSRVTLAVWTGWTSSCCRQRFFEQQLRTTCPRF